MKVKDVFALLQNLGNEKVYRQNLKQGAGENQFGVKLGDIRKLAQKIKTNHELALQLWDTGNSDARFLAILLMQPEKLGIEQTCRMVQSIKFVRVADWFNSYILNKHPEKDQLREKWLQSDHPMEARSGWSLTAEKVAKNPEGLDIPSLLDRIENEMAGAAPEVQWTMNFTLANIGIYFPELRQRAISVGEKLGIYKDYPVSKGCTSPFAPVWINEMVGRMQKT